MNVEVIRDYLTKALAELDLLPPPVILPPVLHVKAGDNLQAIVDAAPDGAEIRVEPGTYPGLRLTKAHDVPVTIRPDTFAGPLDGERANPLSVSSLIRLRGSLNHSAVVIESGARGYVLIGLQPLAGADVSYAQVVCGDPEERDPTKVARDIVFDRCLLLADSGLGGKRGFALNCGTVSVLNSYVAGFWFGDDSQAIAGWNGPGPFLIDNCYLEASGEVVIFGGADPTSEAMQPRNLTLRRSTLTANPAWRGLTKHTRKNGLELKNCLGALIEDCVIEHSWQSGQAGALVLITPRNQSGGAPYSTVTDVLMRRCVLRHAGAGFQIQGEDDEHPSARVANIRIEDVLLYDIDPKTWNNPTTLESASGRLLQVTRGPVNVSLERITAIASRHNSFLNIDGPGLADGFRWTNSVLSEGKYGMLGPGLFGVDAWAKFVSNGTCDGNLIAHMPTGATVKYPAGNTLSLLSEGVTDAGFNVLPKYARAGLGCDLTGLPAF